MFRLLIILLIVGTFSCRTGNIFPPDINSQISVGFRYKGRINLDLLFSIYNSELKDRESFYRHTIIPRELYQSVLENIQGLYCLKNNKIIPDYYIVIDIIEKGNTVERFEFRSDIQIIKYIQITDSLLGENNYIPEQYREYIKNKKDN